MSSTSFATLFTLSLDLAHIDLHSFPTRRSSDLVDAVNEAGGTSLSIFQSAMSEGWAETVIMISAIGQFFCGMACLDRKSTRLNSSHLVISYAVFCLKKKME